MKYYNPEKNLVTLSNSILKHFGGETYHETLKELDDILAKKEYKKVVIFLFDGLGTYIENLHLKEKHSLIKHRAFEMSSVFPPTTVAATTALLSAKYPAETGWLGWSQYFPQIDQTVDMFSGRNSFTREYIEPHPSKTYVPYVDIIDIISHLPSCRAYNISSARVDPNGAKSLSHLFRLVHKALEGDEKTFIYAYWPDPDHNIHVYGVKNFRVHHIVRKISRKIDRFARKNKDTLVISLADHGLLDVEPIFLDEHPDLYELLINDDFLDSRTASFRIKDVEKNGKTFETLFKKYYGDEFDFYTKQEVIDEHLFGTGKIHPLFSSLLGDYLVVSKGNKCLICPKKFNKKVHKGAHSGSALEERMIYVSIYNQ